MKTIIFLAALTLTGCAQPKTNTQVTGKLTVQSYTASTDGFGVGVSSHLILGPTEAILVDGQLYRSDADAVVELVRASRKKLTTVFLTHAHPDHFMGLDVIRTAFPDATFVSVPGVVADFAASAPATFQALKSKLGPAVADQLVTLAALAEPALSIDGEPVEVTEVASPGESAHAAMLALPTESAAITGDLVYRGVHLYLGECTSSGWKSDLDALATRQFKTLYPGHGPAGDATALQATAGYLDDVVSILQTNPGRAATDAGADPRIASAVATIEAKFPGWKSEYLVTASTTQYYAACDR